MHAYEIAVDYSSWRLGAWMSRCCVDAAAAAAAESDSIVMIRVGTLVYTAVIARQRAGGVKIVD